MTARTTIAALAWTGVENAKRPVWQLIAMGIGLALFLAGLGGALYLTSRTQSLRATTLHALNVESAARDLLGAIQEAEAGQRGYLLTHDERYLAPYFVSAVTLKAISRNLADLTHADPAVAAQVSALGPLVDQKIAEMADTIDLEQRNQHARALAVVNNDSGRQTMDDLRARLDAIVRNEQDKVYSGRATIDRVVDLTRVDIIATLLLGVALLTVIVRARSRLLRDLASQNATLEERIRERTAALESRTRRVETLMQDMSHRIGNSLSLVTGFLDLQARASKSDEVKIALAAARQRVFSIASAQRRMRLAMDSDSVETIGFLDALIEDMRNALPDHRISISADIEPSALPSQDAAAFGVILNELIANALKHAWAPGDQGELKVQFRIEENERVLVVSDDGRGHSREDMSGGLGKILIQSLVQSLRGTMTAEPARDDPERPGLWCEVRAPR